MRGVVAVIPCYNEAHYITDIVTRAKRHVGMVIVADDCSADGTVLEAQRAGALVVAGGKRRGFGGNLIAGIGKAISFEDYDIVLTLDGDGQHNPDEIPKVLEPVQSGEADMVIGSRFLRDYECPRYRKFGIDIITWLYNFGHRQKISDAQSCFRAYRRELLEDLVLEDEGFGFSTEILIKARAKGHRIVEVPVSCIYHEDLSMNSTMNPIVHGVGVALSTIKWRLRLRNGGDKRC